MFSKLVLVRLYCCSHYIAIMNWISLTCKYLQRHYVHIRAKETGLLTEFLIDITIFHTNENESGNKLTFVKYYQISTEHE